MYLSEHFTEHMLADCTHVLQQVDILVLCPRSLQEVQFAPLAACAYRSAKREDVTDALAGNHEKMVRRAGPTVAEADHAAVGEDHTAQNGVAIGRIYHLREEAWQTLTLGTSGGQAWARPT